MLPDWRPLTPVPLILSLCQCRIAYIAQCGLLKWKDFYFHELRVLAPTCENSRFAKIR